MAAISPAAHPARPTRAPSIPAPSLKYSPDTQDSAIAMPAPMISPPAMFRTGLKASPWLSSQESTS